LAEDLNPMGAANNEVLKWNGTIWAPAPDAGGTTYSGGNGLTLNGTAFDVDNLVGQVTGPTSATVIADGSISGGELGQIIDNSITASDLAPDSVDASEIRVDAVGQSEIRDDAVTTSEILNATILNEDIQNSTIEPTKMNASGNNDEVLTISGGNVVWAPVTPTGSGNISSPNSTITIGGAANALLGNVTIDLTPNSIGAGEIDDNAIGLDELQNDAVNSDKIVDGSIGNVDMGSGIDGNKIVPDFGLQNIQTGGNINIGGTVTVQTVVVHPDYVFQKYFLGNSILNPKYKFQSLEEIEAFVKENNHLPGIQSAAAIKEQGFWNLGEASRINLEKIEELFLHTIEQEKKIKALETTNKDMANEIELLKAQMEEIKQLMLEKTKE
ncbi:hypothetical protein SAMN04488009_0250, partial [Maribacter sedimenticola]